MKQSQLFRTYRDVDFDEEGFWLPPDKGTLVRWADVVRVALCYEIHPIAVADWDYWGFQTTDPGLYPWVEINEQTEARAFTQEVYRRYGKPDIPPMKDWADSQYCITTYIIHPKAEIGRTLYVTRKRHWWSQGGDIYHAQI